MQIVDNSKEKCNYTECYIYKDKKGYVYTFYDNLKEWTGMYIDYKKGIENKNPYNDPDIVSNATVDNLVYYEDITQFLQIQESKRKRNGKETIISYVAPKMGEKIQPPDDRTITVKKGNEERFHLTSDQFGFSEEGHNYRYPYYALMCKSNNPDETLEFIAECLYYTRSIGGAFLWPKIQAGEKWDSLYNMKRGTSTYIRDRVDITLWEICQAYKVIREIEDLNKAEEEIKKELRNINEGRLLILNQRDNVKIAKWLSIFEDFDGYVDYFKFDAFVMKDKGGETVPINIIESDLSIYERVPIDNAYVEDLKKKKKSNIELLEYEELEIMLKNVIAMTRKRSEDMWKIINENQ